MYKAKTIYTISILDALFILTPLPSLQPDSGHYMETQRETPLQGSPAKSEVRL